MSPSCSSPLLDDVLRIVARRYRVPETPAACADDPAASLAAAMEAARDALAHGQAPGEAVRDRFLDALASLIRDAVRPGRGDAAFQASVLRHRAPQVREYASLAAHEARDRRRVRAIVDAIHHPARPPRAGVQPHHQAFADLYEAASAGAWAALADTARALLAVPAVGREAGVAHDLRRLLDEPALARLRRLAALGSDDAVRQYGSLWERHGPRSGSAEAAVQGSTGRRRGAAVEAMAAAALEKLARRLNEAEAPTRYRVVTSMHVPAAIVAGAERAKAEWDVALLRQADADAVPAWDVCLLLEAKASADAATTDFPRLLRGLRLLAQASIHASHPFATAQGLVRLRGASLHALGGAAADLACGVLYCSDAPADTGARALGAASRMQLLSSEVSLAFACRLAEGGPVAATELEPLWHELLGSPRWEAVLQQYAMLRRVRERMVHVEDLTAAVDGIAGAAPPRAPPA